MCLGKIIARDLRLAASRLYRMAVTRPASRAAITHGQIAAAREVCNSTSRLGDGSRLILRQRARGYVRAVRAVRNTRVFQLETGVVADAGLYGVRIGEHGKRSLICNLG